MHEGASEPIPSSPTGGIIVIVIQICGDAVWMSHCCSLLSFLSGCKRKNPLAVSRGGFRVLCGLTVSRQNTQGPARRLLAFGF